MSIFSAFRFVWFLFFFYFFSLCCASFIRIQFYFIFRMDFRTTDEPKSMHLHTKKHFLGRWMHNFIQAHICIFVYIFDFDFLGRFVLSNLSNFNRIMCESIFFLRSMKNTHSTDSSFLLMFTRAQKSIDSKPIQFADRS